MNPGVTEEVGKTTRGFFDVLKDQPLSLSLVVMNFLLVAYLFYSGAATLAQRKETTDLIVKWQRDTDQLMANCVSKDVMELVVNALERDRVLIRSLLPLSPLVVPPPGGKPLEFPKEFMPPPVKMPHPELQPRLAPEKQNKLNLPPLPAPMKIGQLP